MTLTTTLVELIGGLLLGLTGGYLAFMRQGVVYFVLVTAVTDHSSRRS